MAELVLGESVMITISVNIELVDECDKLALEDIVSGLDSSLERDKICGLLKNYETVVNDG